MAKILASINSSRSTVSDLTAALDAIQIRDDKEGFSANELAAAKKMLGNVVKELKPYTSRITSHSLWAMRETLKEAETWLDEHPDKKENCGMSYNCSNACRVSTHSVTIDITTTDDGKEIVFGSFHNRRNMGRVVCFDDPAGPTDLATVPPPPPAPVQAVKTTATIDPKTAQLLSQGLKALMAGDNKRAKEVFLEARRLDPSNTLIEKYIEKCDGELKGH